MNGQPFLSVVIPAYNEERRIVASLRQVLDYLAGQSYHSEVLVVDDGSSDSTAAQVAKLVAGSRILSLLREQHRGKGHAVKAGMLAARGQYRFLCDADLSMPVEQLARFLPPQLQDYDIAIGSREAAGARRIGEPRPRHLMGRVFNLMVRWLAVPGISDTQCGFKCFRDQAAQVLFPRQSLDGFGFDVEVLFLARKRRMKLVEVPIDWYYRSESKVRPFRHSLSMLNEVLRVRWNWWRGRYNTSSGGTL
ncbi:MAG: glycosyltransferase family 2 protein [Chloroflexi bacterium]|nr:glycosyltransferase family 2 protein [Chloroflexota bacterium]